MKFLLFALLFPHTPAAGQVPMSPRMAQAVEAAARQRREAEQRHTQAVAASTAAAAEAALAVARARSWEQALQKAAPSALPMDADAVVAAVRGDGRLERAGQATPLAPGAMLRESDGLVLGEATAEVRFHDGSSLSLAPQSELRVVQPPRSMPQQSLFALNRGALRWEASPGLAGATRVLTPRSVASLRAGAAELRVDADGTGALRVFSGASELAARPDAAPTAPSGWWEAPFK